ncbi:epidermal growth factor-like protein 7 isoform X3 [Equus quagga]|uniref:epidermal growth factor-like protein 7 isoform X3 n=1 Tax=Equus quagga TaxID=89248 RepID=UPI001EE21749|nr:epidermal growth factor-like protein 7 isoform X3 [Equus quagga]
MGHSPALAPLLSQATPAVCLRNARPFVRWKGQAPAQRRHGWPPLPRRAAATRVQGMTEPPSLAAGCVPSGFPGTPCPSPSCNACTSPFSPPATGTEPAAHTGHPVCLLPTCICEGSPILSAPLHFWGARPHHCWLTIYRTAYRRSPGPAPARPRYACCPGWKRTSGLPGACGVVCQPPCQNGGVCVQPGRCHCPAGWRGDTCQTDVDECSAGQGGCPQRCVNTAGSYWCQCWEGHSPSADGAICLPKRGTARVPHPHPTTEAAAGAGPTAQPGLAGPGARAPGPRQPPGPLLPAAGPHRLPERADLLPGRAAGVLFLQEGAVTGRTKALEPMDCLLTPPSPLYWA